MDPEKLEVGKKYVVVEEVTVCFYEGDDCIMPESPNLPTGTILTYVGPDNDQDGGYVFEDKNGTKYCLHDNATDNDLLYINFAE